MVPRGPISESGPATSLSQKDGGGEKHKQLIAAERELAKVMKQSAELTALARLQLLESMDAADEHDELLAEITNDIEKISEKAQGSDGERKKYLPQKTRGTNSNRELAQNSHNTIEALEEIEVASWLLGARGVGWPDYYSVPPLAER